MNIMITVLNCPRSARMKIIFSCQLVLCLRDWFSERTERRVVLKFDWQKQSARVCLHASRGLSFLISSLSNLDHLEGSWATRPHIQVSVSCLCTVDNQARHTVIFLLCFKEFFFSSKIVFLPYISIATAGSSLLNGVLGPSSTWCLSSLPWLTQCVSDVNSLMQKAHGFKEKHPNCFRDGSEGLYFWASSACDLAAFCNAKLLLHLGSCANDHADPNPQKMQSCCSLSSAWTHSTFLPPSKADCSQLAAEPCNSLKSN